MGEECTGGGAAVGREKSCGVPFTGVVIGEGEGITGARGMTEGSETTGGEEGTGTLKEGLHAVGLCEDF